MSKTVEEIVYAESEDGVSHAGLIIRPDGEPARSLAVVWIHGLTGRFYEPHAVRIGRDLAARGYTFIVGNNRGHDAGALIHRSNGESELAGGYWERFEESLYDVAGWLNFAESQGFASVALVGHSLGALKVGYYQALRQDPRVRGLAAASPPIHAGRIDPELHARAVKLQAEGRSLEVFNLGVLGVRPTSVQTLLSRARTNIDVYGFHTPDPLVAKIACPLLVFWGTNEPMVGGADNLPTVRQNAAAAPRVDTAIVEGADHVYRGHEAEVAALLGGWVEGL
ncbi:MAG TPA: alpha/beta fold hydrolase [Chloroflexota bacterium]|nr:alpha/beta fold hydrolase [Chloroflexota bacterium]